MTELSLVSTLICTYNAENFIEKTIESVINQTYKNQEILILDNNSSDNTLNILNKYSKIDSRIKVFSESKNLWAYNWLNYLLDNSKGKYIAIQDHDDIWHPKKLEIQVEFLNNNDYYIWSWTGTLIYYGKSKIGYLYDNNEKDSITTIHTSLVFRNLWFRYDTSIIFCSDLFFMKHILTKWQKKIKIHWEILTLHYYKEDWTNYSEHWFKLNYTNIKRFFDVYWLGLYSFILFFYILLMKILPFNIRYKIDIFLLKNIKKAKSYNCLLQYNSNIYEMLSKF